MSFGKFHESEGLAAISRALKAKKEVPEQKVRKHDNGSTPAGGSVQKVIQEKGADEGKKKKKKKRQHSAEPQDAHESAEALDSRVQKKDKKTKKSKEKETAVADTVRDKEESPGAKKDKPSKKAKKGKEGKCSKGSGSAAENGNESAAVTEKGGCVSAGRLVQLVHEAKQHTEDSLFGEAAEVPSTALDAAGASGARAVTLLLHTLQCCSDMHRQQRKTASAGEPQNGVRSEHFRTAEEALHTDSGAAGCAGLHAQKLWSAVMQCNSEAALTAKTALRCAEPHAPHHRSLAGNSAPVRWSSFGDFYRSSFVGAYAEDLEAIRTSSNERPVKPELLLKCMQAGTSVFSQEDQVLLLAVANSRDPMLPSAASAGTEVGSVHSLLRSIPL
eukprot:CAMPEP_0117689164 /NCGR_PEP_ID=MMETSP0804-20121206/24309_1 /TAXON_ID=1074897 /ORGANISM="Tetraselmis astigmatica, Strain CCMP880" /LENGTH=386 /DNA_ID=CAMNT_0005501849 /DNA_START=143 /DNA_END=1303 /DNA_ORIENTATION=-